MNKVYKIQNAQGLYSTGGFSPAWTSQGKVWRSQASMKSHVTQVMNEKDNPYKGAGVKVVEYFLAPTRLFPVEEAHLVG